MNAAEVEKQLEICLGESGIPVGTLWFPTQGSRAYSVFQYGESWLTHPRRFAIAPDLPLIPDRQFFRKAQGVDQASALPPALADTVPDLWGRRLLQAMARANHDGSLSEVDYLVAVDDASRMGALRLRVGPGSPFLTDRSRDRPAIPPILHIDVLTRDIAQIERDHPDRETLARLAGVGSSLGGARPKCSVIDTDGSLAVAKFTSRHDTHAVEKAEVLTLLLARECGLDIPDARLVYSGGAAVAILRRFDRRPPGRKHGISGESSGRIPYLSAQSFLNLPVATGGTYVDFADQLRQYAERPENALRDLFSRVSFSILVSNTDDHLKNHGLLYRGQGKWYLAPLFDVNPSPERERRLKTAIADQAEPDASTELLLEHAEFFGLSRDDAQSLVGGQARVLRERWKILGRDLGMTSKELREYSPAFEHRDSAWALRLNASHSIPTDPHHSRDSDVFKMRRHP